MLNTAWTGAAVPELCVCVSFIRNNVGTIEYRSIHKKLYIVCMAD